MTAKESLLWGEEFSLPVNDTEKLLDKINSPKKVSSTKKISSKLSLEDKMAVIESNVMAILGKHKDDTEVIRDRDELHRYISKCIENGVLALDTETNNSLDPLTCLIMGACLYTPNEKQAYVPIHHVNRVTNELLPHQLTENDLKEEFSRIVEAKVKVIYHNASFDIRVIRHTCGIDVPYHWDTMIASQILNENEPASLKEQYVLHIDKDHGKYDIEHLFEKESYAVFDPELFALYSATDALMTYKLYDYQRREFEKPENNDVYSLLRDVELPCIRTILEMEDRGIEVDLDYDKALSVKYNALLGRYDEPIQRELDKLSKTIEKWRSSEDAHTMVGNKTKSEQLTDPVNLDSPVQLAIIVYDILKVKPLNKKKPRSVDKNTIPQILETQNIPLLQAYLDRKTFKTLINNFIDKMPEYVNAKDGRVHCSFNQVGAATGRQSCSKPNLQQIPSKNHEIRLMFKATDGYTLVGSDFSAQEPRLLANYSRDPFMIDAFKNNRDLYASIASKVYHNAYEDNLEFDPRTGKRSEAGAKRRSSCKSLLLGIMYGMSVQGIASRLECSVEEAQAILSGFYNEFPKVREWTDKTIADAKKNGYVTDWHGRRRRLPELLLKEYEVSYYDKNNGSFNPILTCNNRSIDPKTEKQILDRLSKARGAVAINSIIREEWENGILVHKNGQTIARAERQCVNARIQGGAATMTKVAMIKIHNDEELNRLGFRLLISVHDELIGECPKENADEVAKRLSYVMSTCIAEHCVVPFKCDADVSERWYYNVYCNELQTDKKAFMGKGMTEEQAIDKICEEHIESTRDFILKCLNN